MIVCVFVCMYIYIEVETVAGGQLPNHHLHGFVLRSTFQHAHDPSSGSRWLVRRKMQFDDHPHLLGSTAQGAQKHILKLIRLRRISLATLSRSWRMEMDTNLYIACLRQVVAFAPHV